MDSPFSEARVDQPVVDSVRDRILKWDSDPDLLGVPVVNELVVSSVRDRLLELADQFPAGPVFQLLMDTVDVIDWLEHRLEPKVWEED
jgi:hypothetical protein